MGRKASPWLLGGGGRGEVGGGRQAGVWQESFTLAVRLTLVGSLGMKSRIVWWLGFDGCYTHTHTRTLSHTLLFALLLNLHLHICMHAHRGHVAHHVVLHGVRPILPLPPARPAPRRPHAWGRGHGARHSAAAGPA